MSNGQGGFIYAIHNDCAWTRIQIVKRINSLHETKHKHKLKTNVVICRKNRAFSLEPIKGYLFRRLLTFIILVIQLISNQSEINKL